MFNITKGASLFCDFILDISESTISITPTLASEYTIYDNDSNIVLSGILARMEDEKGFELRITSGDMNTLEVGSYVLLVAVLDDSVGYKEYVKKETLIINSIV